MAINLDTLRRILLVRLRSIGDTVLMTPVLEVLKQWSPEISISVVSEPLSAPVLEAHPLVDQLFTVPRTRNKWHDLALRGRLIRDLRRERFDLAVNLHGGTTAAWICWLSGTPHRIGFALPNTKFLLTTLIPPPQEVWQKKTIHCVEQQLAWVKYLGIPIHQPPVLSLNCDAQCLKTVAAFLTDRGIASHYAVFHPAAAFTTKQWAPERFAKVIEYVKGLGLKPIICVAKAEAGVAQAIQRSLVYQDETLVIDHFSLSETMALIAGASLFVGNDSGPAHIAAALRRPMVVVFGSSNEDVWHPWTSAPHQIVRHHIPCVPCAGYTCHAFPEPECIKGVEVKAVINAIDSVLGR
ncbi:MAG TPA: glycosyltransferase family 9 protein [Acidobacteriota bacterium]|nr:glycosyltransferase family 9 protein [Acidobacteriota bacterium]